MATFVAETAPAMPIAPVSGDERPRLVYLAGSGHTGSTLLALLMSAHPAVATVGEIAVKPKIRHAGRAALHQCSCGALVTECRFWQSVFQKVNDQGLEFGPANWTNDYRFTHPVLHRLLSRDSSPASLRSLRLWMSRHLPVYRHRTEYVDRVNAAFVRAVLQVANAEVFLDTSKGRLRLAWLLTSSAFNLRVVTLVRDVRAYAASSRKRGLSVHAAAQKWKRDQLAARSVTRTLPADRRLIVKYEDLCSDPSATLERLHRFSGVAPLGVPPQPFCHEHHVLGNNMRMATTLEIRVDETWRQTLSQGDCAAVLRVAGALNREFGYPD